jgi:hypothetical protein
MYKQTKESFERFLDECRMQAQNIKLPLAPHVDCPICGQPAHLDKEPTHHLVQEYAYKGIHYYYWCHGCKEGFTTNESNELTLATFKLVEKSNTNP